MGCGRRIFPVLMRIHDGRTETHLLRRGSSSMPNRDEPADWAHMSCSCLPVSTTLAGLPGPGISTSSRMCVRSPQLDQRLDSVEGHGNLPAPLLSGARRSSGSRLPRAPGNSCPRRHGDRSEAAGILSPRCQIRVAHLTHLLYCIYRPD